MKVKIKLISTIFLVFILTSFANSQNLKTTISTSFKNDSIELNLLITKILKWHDTDKKEDFELTKNHQSDTFYSGVNWTLYKQRVLQLEKTNLFAKEFLDTYQKIATHLDKELKANPEKYYVGELPPYGNETNEWCNCQDYPSNIWKKLKIVNLKLKDNIASFKWTWGNNFLYSVKAKKENNVWKITELEGFNIKNFSW